MLARVGEIRGVTSTPVIAALAAGVLTVTIDRPDQRNAVNAEVVDGLLAALGDAAGRDEVGVVVLTGAGERAFCAGGDLGGLQGEASAVARHAQGGRFADLLLALRRLPKPVIARVNGDALAGGFGLALACDLLVAAEGARLGTTEVRVGLWPHLITTVLTDHLGPKRTLELMMTGRRLSAAEAAEWGLVNRVVPAADLDQAVAELAGQLLALSPLALALGKRSYTTASDMRREDALVYLAGMLDLHLRTEDLAEGIAAFLQKREPQWRGR